MPISPNFAFSQASLQDYRECKKRFYLRYVRRLAWPAVEAEPVLENERYLQQGSRFHLLVHQSLLGVPREKLEAMAHENGLNDWWQNYQEELSWLQDWSGSLYPEVYLSAGLEGYTMMAKCDLVVTGKDGCLRIFDWKTNRKRPAKSQMISRLQSKVYPYLLVKAGAHLNGGKPIQPEQVEMVYWFAQYPQQPEHIPYNSETYRQDENELGGLIREITSLGEAGFVPSSDLKRSLFCVYRSLCGHGEKAGSLDELEDEADMEAGGVTSFDFEQIAEIEY